ncbi:MAG TPA: rhodanese-like domain-containing protein [Pyrinomonadaceae bacterium]|jgi:3-mercaptopyruvate sulfurtransferase SseA
MTRKFYTTAGLALAAAALLLGGCKAGDAAGDAGAATAASKAQAPAATKDAPTGTTVVHADGVRRVGPAELQKMVESGEAVVYDTRAKASYDQEHIKGALSMPHDEVEKRAGEFPKGKTLAFYCT